MIEVRTHAAFVPDESVVATSHKGLTYPFGGAAPGMGEVMTVADGLRWVRLHVPGPLKHINCWLIDDDGGVALVDAGMNLPDARDAWKTVAKGPLAGVRFTRVIGTHFHPDHIGLAGWMCAYHDCPLVMTRGEWLTARMLIADARDAVPDDMIAFWRGAGWDEAQLDHARERGWAGFRRITTPLPLGYVRIADGDTLTIGAHAWRVIVGSGHSPEHACLLDEERGMFIAGDQVLPRISSNISLGVTEPEGDPLDREHRERLDELEMFLAEPRRAVDCFGRLFRRAIGSDMIGMATGEALAHLRRLEIEGRAVRDTRDGVWWWRATR